jgi:hypothetical protein
MSPLSVTMTKCPGQTTYKEERFILAHQFESFSSWSLALGSVAGIPYAGVSQHRKLLASRGLESKA